MSGCLDPNTNPIAGVRALIQDTDTPPILDDDTIRWFLKLNNQNVMKAAQLSAQAILFRFAQFCEESVGPLSFKGGQAAASYKSALLMFLSNPNFSVALNTAIPFAGGISRADIAANYANPDNLVPSPTRSTLSESDTYPSLYQESNPFNRHLQPRTNPYSV